MSKFEDIDLDLGPVDLGAGWPVKVERALPEESREDVDIGYEFGQCMECWFGPFILRNDFICPACGHDMSIDIVAQVQDEVHRKPSDDAKDKFSRRKPKIELY